MTVQAENAVAVIGAGVIGCAVAWALAHEGRRVLLIDRDEPGRAGASFGNVGHIAAELVEPLPSPQLLFGFWKELFALDGPLSVPLKRLPQFAPWAWRFATAAFRREAHTQQLAPLVKPSAAAMERWLAEIGRPELLRRNGHYEIWMGGRALEQARAQARSMDHLGIRTEFVSSGWVDTARVAAAASSAAGLWFPDSAHVLDPFEIVRAFAAAAIGRGTTVRRDSVRSIRVRGDSIELAMGSDTLRVDAAVVCAGAWSAPLLEPFGLRVPLEAANGYHIELPGHAPLVEAPILYSNERVLVTPMAGRIRCSSYMEFSGADAAPDPRKPARLREKVIGLGYECEKEGSSWMGPRPVLPDYLPGIGQVPGAKVFYAVGHQHIGLTIAPVTGEVVADMVAGREPRVGVSGFDLRRFGRSQSSILGAPSP